MRTYKKIVVSLLISIVLVTSGCSDDFLYRSPLDELTEETAFITYDNFKTYSWGFYDMFEGYPTGEDYGNPTPPQNERECNSDNFNKSQSGYMSPYKYQTKSEVSTSSTYTDAYSFIRRVNIMLQNIDGSAMTDAEKDHWRAVGLFFRAFRYYTLLTNYGGVIWIDQVVKDSDSDIYLAKRNSRDEVAKNILNDLLWAEDHIKTDGEGENTVNVHIVRAVISRFGLFEGTWRKYHGLSDSETYLNASANASQKLIGSFPNLMSSYDSLWNLYDLPVGVSTGVLLARRYSNLVTKGSHSIGRVVRTSSWYYDLTKNAVESYLCTDGKPIGSSSVYEGDDDMYKEFRNRDRRLYYTVLPPYKIIITGPAATSVSDDQWELTGVPHESENIEMMKTITTETGKYLPARNYAGYLLSMSPHFSKFPNGQGFMNTGLGYYYWKYYNRIEDGVSYYNSVENYPVFRMGEILVNHAEAMFELGKFDQSVANQTINKLRTRVDMPPMNVSEITAAFDPARDQTVDPVLWEIRRERRVELMGDGFRFDDLKRWKKGDYVNEQALGAKVKNSDFDNNLTILNNAEEGNVIYFGKPAGWLEKYYLEPIPIQEQILNPNLEQNPGWKDYSEIE